MRRDRLMAVPLACAFLLGVATAGAEAAVAPACEAAADVRAPNRLTGLARRAAAAHAGTGAARARRAGPRRARRRAGAAGARPAAGSGRPLLGQGAPAFAPQRRDRLAGHGRDRAAADGVADRRDAAPPAASTCCATARSCAASRSSSARRRRRPPPACSRSRRPGAGTRRTFLGSWVLSLSAHSDVLMRYDGGDGRAALHGRGGASFLDPLGTAASHGCVRLSNETISWLVRTIGRTRLPGTPVRIQ